MNTIIIILLSALIICVIITLIFTIRACRKAGGDRAGGGESGMKMFSDVISQNQKEIGSMQNERFKQMNREIKIMRQSMERQLSDIYKNFSDISSLTSGVNDLRRVLSNVKTRGILGEIQLGAILEEILSPEQYDKNVVTVPGRSSVVEFAVKLPRGEDGFIYLPIDSKFPLDAYSALQDAYDSGDKAGAEDRAKTLVQRIKLFARDIRKKYVEPPYTTDFAIMFLPVEGLYLEAVNRGLVETLQREYKVNIAGPSTMAAILNSMQMGFRALALEKRSDEVWKVLGEVKSEFEKFYDILQNAQKRINQTGDELDKLIGARMRAMERRLRDIEKQDLSDFDDF